jgi:prophage DNA circulation protein
MTYKDELQPASFRGIEFGVIDTETLFGRRNVLHEYPLRDEPYAEDLGRKAREFTINAFVIGQDYFGARDALIAAIEDDATPGTLVHPTLGIKTVIPKECRVKFNNKEGGIEYFTLSFVEAGENSFPSSEFDTSFFSDAFSIQSLSDFSDYFTSIFNIDGESDFLKTNALDNINDLVSKINSIVNVGDSSNNEYSDFLSMLDQFENNAEANVSDPAEFGQEITNIVSGLSDVYLNQPVEQTINFSSPIPASNNLANTGTSPTFLQLVKPNHPEIQALEAQKRLQTFGDDFQSIPLTTPSRIQEAANQQSIIDLVRSSSLAEMIRITSKMDFESRQDAINIRNDVDSYILPHLITLADSGQDVPYFSLNKTRTAMIQDINKRAATLKNIKYVKTSGSIPAIVFAYDQYEDASRDSEVISRNRVRNPVFLPAQTNVEILV